jgi:hypothetical protein
MSSATHHAVPVTLREAWAEWLGNRPWDLFLTLTSARKTHPEALHKRFRYCTHEIADFLWGKHWERRGHHGVEYVFGLERHKSGWPHGHAVVRLPGIDLANPNLFNLAYWQKFITDTGGFCMLERPRGQADVLQYTTKYVLKEGDLILSDNLNPREAGNQLSLLDDRGR